MWSEVQVEVDCRVRDGGSVMSCVVYPQLDVRTMHTSHAACSKRRSNGTQDSQLM